WCGLRRVEPTAPEQKLFTLPPPPCSSCNDQGHTCPVYLVVRGLQGTYQTRHQLCWLWKTRDACEATASVCRACRPWILHLCCHMRLMGTIVSGWLPARLSVWCSLLSLCAGAGREHHEYHHPRS